MNSASLQFFSKSKSAAKGGEQVSSFPPPETTDGAACNSETGNKLPNSDVGQCSGMEKTDQTAESALEDEFTPRVAEYKCSSRGCGP